MYSDILTLLVKTIIMISAVIITYFLIPYIKEKIGAVKYDRLVRFTKQAVRGAEQLYTVEEWQQKKSFVLNYIIGKAKDIRLNLSTSDIDIMIEGIVYLIKHSNRKDQDQIEE